MLKCVHYFYYCFIICQQIKLSALAALMRDFKPLACNSSASTFLFFFPPFLIPNLIVTYDISKITPHIDIMLEIRCRALLSMEHYAEALWLINLGS